MGMASENTRDTPPIIRMILKRSRNARDEVQKVGLTRDLTALLTGSIPV